MRAIPALLCLFYGSPDDVMAEDRDTVQESKVDQYRAFLAKIGCSTPIPKVDAPTDLPEILKNAIEVWTGSRA